MWKLFRNSGAETFLLYKGVILASIQVRVIPTLVLGSYNDQCVILRVIKMLDPEWRKVADIILKFMGKSIDKKICSTYNDN